MRGKRCAVQNQGITLKACSFLITCFNMLITYRIYPCIMRTFFPRNRPSNLRCVLYTDSIVWSRKQKKTKALQ